MIKLIVMGLASILFSVTLSEPMAQQKQEIRTVTLKVSGLRCQGCCSDVEEGLRQLEGVQEAKANLKTATVTVKYDESVVPVSHVTLALASIPHTVGARSLGTPFSGRLMLTLQKGNAGKVAQALAKLEGVQKVDREKNTLLITFKRGAKVRYAQLEEAVRKAGGTLVPVQAVATDQAQTTLRKSSRCCQPGP